MEELKGKFLKTSAGFEKYEIFDADSSFIYIIATVLVDLFNFTQHDKPLIGLEQVFMDFVKDEIKITVGWDYGVVAL